MKKLHNIFVNSAVRRTNESLYNFSIQFTNTAISANENQTIKINVISFDMMNTFYNVNENTGNNTFTITQTDTNGVSNPITTTYIIPFGNYSVLTFRDTLNSILANKVIVSYNTAQNSFTFKLHSNASPTNKYFIDPLNTKKLLGISVKTEITSVGTTGTFVNMVNFNKVILKLNNIDFDYFVYDCVQDKKDNLCDHSNILFWISKQDVEPFKMISYNNIDGGNSFNFNTYNKEIDVLDFSLINENGEDLKDAPSFLMSLQITIEDKEENYSKAVVKIVMLLNDIYNIILEGLYYIGFFSVLTGRKKK